ncbi:putative lipid II flippase FtsW [Pseudomarimonas salicorniae]|uniref:Probable peptidoglycan glycosyltransferase FtsW n=1 Tax=Pseudomarimonas salicorniae TaxID=2933270 RepID=A0ABT0GHD9_9GAMM|nr:putative lipid II flippase FtsW [Lysobacter sp. CAU 1642]MCK7593960.1 putative lipid II flippase FtsW [Lysobacter sp. CAU 1642]
MGNERFHQALRAEEIEGRYDRVVLLAAAALASLGVVMIGSSSLAVAEGLKVDDFHFLIRHVVFLAAGLGLGLALARYELRELERYSRMLLLLGFLLLLAVFIPGLGRTVNGAQRWLNLGITGFQAVEAVKLLLIIWTASYLARYRDQVQTSMMGALKPFAVVGAMTVLLLMQPDFGSAALLLAITAGMIWLGGVRIVHVLVPALCALPLLAWAAVSESYRVRRLTSFLDPWADPFKDGFQLTQALIAIGRGEWLGVGLGGSVQKLFYLPEAHTDFIFAVIAEELGFAGILLVIGLFVVLVGRAMQIGLRGVEMGRTFAGFCAFGVGLWLGLQAFVSIGVNLGLLPTKGLTLPLVSSGGSSVLMTCAALGVLLRVSYELDRSQRQVALHRGEPRPLQIEEIEEVPLPPPAINAPLRLGRNVRLRVEPQLGETV